MLLYSSAENHCFQSPTLSSVPPQMKTFCGIVFLALIFAASAAFACYQAYVFGFQAKFYAKTRSWKETNATVISLRITTSSDGEGRTYHHCHVRYNYTVNGSTYNGSRASIYGMTGSLNLCNRLEKKRGLNEIKCLYNPTAPQESTLSRRFRVVYISFCLVSFFFAALFGFGGIISTCVLFVWPNAGKKLCLIPAFLALLCSVAAVAISVEVLNHGDRSAIASPNSWEWGFFYFYTYV